LDLSTIYNNGGDKNDGGARKKYFS
jgi:hypothetical protein